MKILYIFILFLKKAICATNFLNHFNRIIWSLETKEQEILVEISLKWLCRYKGIWPQLLWRWTLEGVIDQSIQSIEWETLQSSKIWTSKKLIAESLGLMFYSRYCISHCRIVCVLHRKHIANCIIIKVFKIKKISEKFKSG